MMPLVRTEERLLSELLAGIVTIPAEQDVSVCGLDSDSRRLQAGAVYLACASQDGKRHGLDYLDQVISRGPSAILWESAENRSAPSLDIPVLEVTGLTDHVSTLASRALGGPSQSMCVVGVTGTDGKTSVAHLLAQAMGLLGLRAGYIGTLGYGALSDLSESTHTTPDAVALQHWLASMKEQGVGHVAMEVSSHALDQGRVGAVAFNVAVLTNLGRDHLDYHGDLAAYHQAKKRLFKFDSLEAVIINADDEVGSVWLSDIANGVERVAFSLNQNLKKDQVNADRVVRAQLSADASGMCLDCSGDYGEFSIRTSLVGRFNASNLLAVAAVMLQQGFSVDSVADVASRLTAVPGRMEVVSGDVDHAATVIVDYAHTPQALEQALAALRDHLKEATGKLYCVFGCGGDRDKGKRPLMAAVAEKLADRIIVTDDNPRTESPKKIVSDIVAGFNSRAKSSVIHNRRKAIETVLSEAKPGDMVLIAGKGHEDYQLVGNERLDFDDRQVVRSILDGEGGAAC